MNDGSVTFINLVYLPLALTTTTTTTTTYTSHLSIIINNCTLRLGYNTLWLNLSPVPSSTINGELPM